MRTIFRFFVEPIIRCGASTSVIWVGLLVMLVALLFTTSSIIAVASLFWALANLVGAALGRAGALYAAGQSVATCAVTIAVNVSLFYFGGKIWRAAG